MQGYYGDDYASPSECIVRVRGILKRITNINRTTSVHNVIEALLFNTYEDALEPSDCCLYMERDSCLFPLRHTDYMQDLLLRYSTRNRAEILFTLAFKRIASPSRLKQRYAQRKKLMRSTLSAIDNNRIPAVTEQLRTQESLIRRQQEIISELQKVVLNNGTNSKNYYNCNTTIQNERTRDHKENGSRKSRYDVISQSREKENAGKQCYFPQQNNLPSKTRHSSSLQRRTKVRFNENTGMKKNLFEQLIDDYNLLKKSKEQQPLQTQLKSILKESSQNLVSESDDDIEKTLVNGDGEITSHIGTAIIRRTPKSLRRSISVEQNMLNCDQSNDILQMLREKCERSQKTQSLVYDTDSDNSDTGISSLSSEDNHLETLV